MGATFKATSGSATMEVLNLIQSLVKEETVWAKVAQLVIIIIFVIGVCLSFFIPKYYCEVSDRSCDSFADVFDLFGLKNTLGLVNYLIAYFQKAYCSGVKNFA